jgi:hypothetical protein
MPRRRAISIAAGDEGGRERTFVVVLEQQGVGIGQRLAGGLDHPVQLGALEQALDLVVDPHDLL